jgi:hypothetical protein
VLSDPGHKRRPGAHSHRDNRIAEPVRYVDRRIGALPELFRGQPGERPRRSVSFRVMWKPRNVDVVARRIQTFGEMLILSGRICEAMKEDDDASGGSAMRQENCAAPRGGDAIVGALLPHDAAHGLGVICSGRSVGYELDGVGRYDGGERNQENRSGDDSCNHCNPGHSESYPKPTSPHGMAEEAARKRSARGAR